jgi:endopolyphosphatase
MLRPRDALVCGLLVWGGASTAAPPSAAIANTLGETGLSDARAAQSGRKLTGRFLHITGGFVGSLLGRAAKTDDML